MSIPRRKLVHGASIVALITTVGALAPAASAAPHTASLRGGSIVVARAGDFDTFDPALSLDYESTRVANLLYSPLIGIRPDTTLYPNLVTAMPTVGDGGRTYTLHLRPGVRFADGSPLTAADVVFSMDRVAAPSTGSGGVAEFVGVAGFGAFEAGKAKTLSGVQALDPLTVRFTLTAPDATFPYRLSSYGLSVVSSHQVARYGKAIAQHPLGSGPYRFVSYTPGQRLVLERNPYYFGHDANGVQLPYLDRITWLINVDDTAAVLKLERGEVDVLADGVPKTSYAAVAADPHFGPLLVHAPTMTTIQIGFNAGMKPFNDVRVRRALSMAIDRARIVKLVGKNQVTALNQRYPRGLDAWDPTYTGLPYDLTAAKTLLAQAGYPTGFTTTYLVGYWPDPADAVVAQAVQQDLARIGVTVKIRTVSLATAGALAAKPNTVPMFTQWWQADFPEATDYLQLAFGCGLEYPHGLNTNYYCNPQVDALIQQAQVTLDHAQRVALEQKAQRLVLDDVPVFPLFQNNFVTIKPARLANFYIHPIFASDYAYYHLAS